MTEMNIAHIRGDGAVQTLEDHLRNTAMICRSFTSKIGMGDAGTIMGLLHDLGKATNTFNEYIMMDDSSRLRGSIDHSTAGAQYLQNFRKAGKDEFLPSLAIEMMQISMVSHHSGLINCISSTGDDVFTCRVMKNQQDTGLEEALKRIDPSILSDVKGMLAAATDSVKTRIENILNDANNGETRSFHLGLLNRFLLSCLIDADRIDTISFQENTEYVPNSTDWNDILMRFNAAMDSYKNDSKISMIRSRISDECFKFSLRKPGIFTLSVPTGGGKTLSSFKFALNHLIKNGMDRIIYVVPYLTIIEQNAHVIESILNINPEDDFVTECHSNADVEEYRSMRREGDDDAETNATWTSPMDSWDGPIIFTSMVQFLEALFGSGTKKIRRMHNLANAVIVFDEVQSLPIKTVYMFNEAINFLCHECGSTAVLCTATQPLLGNLSKHPLAIDSEIIGDVCGLFEDLKRTDIEYINPNSPGWNAEEVANLAATSLMDASSVLVIVNTKRMAESVYHLAKSQIDDDVLVTHLSTNMCPVHRQSVLKQTMSSMGHKKVLCISTQLIEAGVDVDFDVVIRSLSGLDSIAQAAGRCNRNAKRATGKVFVVKTEENVSPLVDIDTGRRCADLVMRHEHSDMVSPDAISDYYRMYFYKRENDMGYRSDKGSYELIDLLSNNTYGWDVLDKELRGLRKGIARQAYSDANHEFKVIDKTNGIIIPYDDTARNMISVLCGEPSYVERKHAMRILQKYTVSTFSLNRLLKAGAVKTLPGFGDSVYSLVDGFYDEDTGIREVSNQEPLIF